MFFKDIINIFIKKYQVDQEISKEKGKTRGI